MSADDAWGGDLPGASVRDLQAIAAPADSEALMDWPLVLDDLEHAADKLSDDLQGALSALGQAATDDDRVVGLIGRVRAIRATLGMVETVATRWAGQSPYIGKTGVLADGTHYEIRRGRDRKAWQHDGWKHDVRERVLDRAGLAGHEVVDTETGELVDLQTLLTWVQEQHGSTAPRVTELRKLGLEPDDYCESFPGLWNVDLIPPEPVQGNG